MKKKRLLVGLCSWNNPSLLKICVGSLLDNIDRTIDSIAVVLNESDLESMAYLRSNNIPFVAHPFNEGVLAIDYLKPFIQHHEYFMNTNDDMFFSKNFADDIISIIEKYYPCTASCKLVENFNSNNPCVIVDPSIENIYKLNRQLFEDRCFLYRGLNLPKMVAYCHPICCKTTDLLMIGGYSNNWKDGYENGYGRDDAFAAQLVQLNKDYKFIQSEKSFVFHQSSETMRRLTPEQRANSNQDSFLKDFGVTINQFKESIHCFWTIKD